MEDGSVPSVVRVIPENTNTYSLILSNGTSQLLVINQAIAAELYRHSLFNDVLVKQEADAVKEVEMQNGESLVSRNIESACSSNADNVEVDCSSSVANSPETLPIQKIVIKKTRAASGYQIVKGQGSTNESSSEPSDAPLPPSVTLAATSSNVSLMEPRNLRRSGRSARPSTTISSSSQIQNHAVPEPTEDNLTKIRRDDTDSPIISYIPIQNETEAPPDPAVNDPKTDVSKLHKRNENAKSVVKVEEETADSVGMGGRAGTRSATCRKRSETPVPDEIRMIGQRPFRLPSDDDSSTSTSTTSTSTVSVPPVVASRSRSLPKRSRVITPSDYSNLRRSPRLSYRLSSTPEPTVRTSRKMATHRTSDADASQTPPADVVTKREVGTTPEPEEQGTRRSNVRTLSNTPSRLPQRRSARKRLTPGPSSSPTVEPIVKKAAKQPKEKQFRLEKFIVDGLCTTSVENQMIVLKSTSLDGYKPTADERAQMNQLLKSAPYQRTGDQDKKSRNKKVASDQMIFPYSLHLPISWEPADMSFDEFEREYGSVQRADTINRLPGMVRRREPLLPALPSRPVKNEFVVEVGPLAQQHEVVMSPSGVLVRIGSTENIEAEGCSSKFGPVTGDLNFWRLQRGDLVWGPWRHKNKTEFWPGYCFNFEQVSRNDAKRPITVKVWIAWMNEPGVFCHSVVSYESIYPFDFAFDIKYDPKGKTDRYHRAVAQAITACGRRGYFERYVNAKTKNFLQQMPQAAILLDNVPADIWSQHQNRLSKDGPLVGEHDPAFTAAVERYLKHMPEVETPANVEDLFSEVKVKTEFKDEEDEHMNGGSAMGECGGSHLSGNERSPHVSEHSPELNGGASHDIGGHSSSVVPNDVNDVKIDVDHEDQDVKPVISALHQDDAAQDSTVADVMKVETKTVSKDHNSASVQDVASSEVYPLTASAERESADVKPDKAALDICDGQTTSQDSVIKCPVISSPEDLISVDMLMHTVSRHAAESSQWWRKQGGRDSTTDLVR